VTPKLPPSVADPDALIERVVEFYGAEGITAAELERVFRPPMSKDRLERGLWHQDKGLLLGSMRP
jgi:hypothetical protein